MKVLIADDSKAMRSIMLKAMKGAGFQNEDYLFAEDGEQAIALVLKEKPDLLLCDLHMPHKTGFDVLQAIKSQHAEVKTIIVSVDTNKDAVRRVMDAGANVFLPKPFSGEKLFNAVTSLIGKVEPALPLSSQGTLKNLPAVNAIERALSSLAGKTVLLKRGSYVDMDFTQGPFAGATIADKDDHIFLAFFLDVVAANTIAAIIKRRPLSEAAAVAKAGVLGEESLKALKAYYGLFTALYPASETQELPRVHGHQHSETPEGDLKQYLSRHRETAVVLAIECEGVSSGRMIFIAPR